MPAEHRPDHVPAQPGDHPVPKSLPFVALLSVLLGACAPARPPVESSPEPEAPAAPRPDPVTEPAEALVEATDRWWLLDERTDRYPGTSADRAYRELLGGRRPARTVVVAILDSGVDLEHEDLDDVLWVNDRELPGNGLDDDGNGYADDVHGWNFIGGPDGRHVHHDTYELTRLYAGLRHLEGADPDTLRGDAKLEYQRFLEISREFQRERSTAVEQLTEMRQIERAVDHFVELLERAVGTDSLTIEAVRKLRTMQPEVQQARQVYINLHDQGFTPQMIREQVDHLEDRVEYGLDPDFDPRPIVGDDYQDATERFYGNSSLEGPDAEHGTHVAGIVAAERDNGIGVDGIASGVRIMVVRVVPDGDERDKDVANAIRYAVDNGADIINMSFGKAHSPRKDVVDAAVRYADEHGVLLVHAAGNDAADVSEEPSYPSRFYLDGDTASNWIEVGASSWRAPSGLAAEFSNFDAERVHVFAPGTDIYSTVPNDRYKRNSGTSMASPVVAGLAALIMAYHPELTAQQVKRIILDSATRYPDREVRRPGSEEEMIGFGTLSATGGIVNAFEAMRMAERVAAGERGDDSRDPR
jgi:subtilisin family serine protease